MSRYPSTQKAMSASLQPVTLAISGMSCGHCVAAVKSALDAVPGVAVQNVTIGSATVALDPATSPDTALAAVREAGYEARLATTAPGTSPQAG